MQDSPDNYKHVEKSNAILVTQHYEGQFCKFVEQFLSKFCDFPLQIVSGFLKLMWLITNDATLYHIEFSAGIAQYFSLNQSNFFKIYLTQSSTEFDHLQT